MRKQRGGRFRPYQFGNAPTTKISPEESQLSEVRGAIPCQQNMEERFLKASCQRDPKAKVRPYELYAAYASWCEQGGLCPKRITQVAAIWRSLGLKRVVIHSYPFYKGVRLLVKGDEKLSFNRWLVRQRWRDWSASIRH